MGFVEGLIKGLIILVRPLKINLPYFRGFTQGLIKGLMQGLTGVSLNFFQGSNFRDKTDRSFIFTGIPKEIKI